MTQPDQTTNITASAAWWRRRWATASVLLLILALGAYFRLVGLSTWDGGTYLHPDERFLIITVNNIAVPSSFADYLRSSCDANGYVLKAKNPGEPPDRQEPTTASGCNTLNPRNYNWSRFYVYGPLPLTVTRLIAEWRGTTSLDELRDLGRLLSTLADLGSVLLAFLIGRRLYGRATGLVAALLLALTVLHIQHAHFFTVDTFSAFFTLLALYWAVRAAQGGGAGVYLALGLTIGAGMAVRLTLAALGLLAIVATVYAIVARRDPTSQAAERRGFVLGWEPEDGAPARTLRLSLALTGPLGRLALLVLAGVMTLLAFRLLQPDAFVGTSLLDVRLEPRFLANMATASETVSGTVDMPPSHQWAGRVGWWFPWKNMLLWGMGLPLGIAAWAGWALAGWQLFRHRRAAHLLPWLWVSAWFGWQGAQFVLTQRYQLPIYGPLTILAAWLVVAATNTGARLRLEWPTWNGQRVRLSPPRWAQWAPLVVVASGTLLWAYAFTRIYTRPYSRVAASRWIYQNVPPGAIVTSEEWDDGLPVSTDGYASNYVLDVQTKPYGEDTPEKFVTLPGAGDLGLLDALDTTDYVILTSNRVYDSVARLPMRFPATLRYYNTLFSGELGFELVADYGSYPTLFGIPIYDQGAEEAFSVYDHPRVLIFKKTAAFSRERAEQLITEGVAWDETYRIRPTQATKAPTALRLTTAQWQAQRQDGTWAALFDPSSLSNQMPVLAWLLVLELIGLAAFVLAWRLLPALPDGGWAMAKMLALLLVAYVAWLLGSLRLMPFGPASVWLGAGLLLGAGALVGWRERVALRAFVRQRWAPLLVGEAIFLLAFAALLLVRYLNPDLWHPARGGEKPMDVAFLNAVLRSTSFPPYDPWFAGGFLNYYYFGFVLVGSLIHLTGIVPAVAYNLAVPTLFALTALGAWGVAYNLAAPATRRSVPIDGAGPARRRVEALALASGLLAALFVPVVGNLAQAEFLLNGYAAANAGRPEWAFWDATRLVDGAINEFPFFTFLFADLHAHMIALPLTTLALALMVALLRVRPKARTQAGAVLLPAALLALVVGAMRATNTWEYPTYLLLSLATLSLLAFRVWRRAASWRATLPLLLPLLLLLAGPTLLFLPFVRSFATDYQGFERWNDELTSTADWLRVNGLWLALLALPALLLARRAFALRWSTVAGTLVGLALTTAVMAVAGLPSLLLTMPLLLGLGALTIWLLVPAGSTAAERAAVPAASIRTLWTLLLAGTALALSVFVELLRVQGDIGRMNTVFKFGLQGWTLAAIAAALALPWAWNRLHRVQPAARLLWAGAAGLLVLAGLAYPLTATPARIADRMGPAMPRTLDGLAFAEAASMDENGQRFDLRGDMAAMRWMQQRVGGTPIVLEAHTEAYRWGGRFAIYTGLPTVLGWPWHETQQRSAVEIAPIIATRQQAVRDVYSGDDAAQTKQLLRRYGVEYVVVGGLEAALYPGARERMAALAGAGVLSLALDGPTQIYQVAAELTGPPQVLHSPAPVQAPSLPSQALMLDRPVDQLPPVNEYAWNSWAQTPAVAAALWLLLLYGLVALGLPLAVFAFGHWRDGGWGWARLLGALAFGYAVWLPVSAKLWAYDRWSLLWSLLLVLLLDAAILWRLGSRAAPGTARLRSGMATVGALLRSRRRAIVQGEALFLLALAGWLVLRLYNPDLWHPIYGGEKPFEFGFLNAILRSPQMPPYDPFYSGGTINYYYYGLFLVSLPIKLLGIAPGIGFNLAVATLGALLAGAAFGLVAQATGRARYGLAGVALVTLLGNLAGALAPGEDLAWMSRGLPPVIDALREGGIGGFGAVLGDWFWGPTRVIPYTINEFPFFSFLFADLHPHMVALPLTLLALALGWNILTARKQGVALQATLAIMPLLLGTLAVTNSWDFPTYGLLLALTLVGVAYRRRAPAGEMLRAFGLALGLPALGLLLFLPFFQHFQAMVQGLGRVAQESPLGSYLLIYGLSLALLVPLLWLIALRVLRHRARLVPAARLGIVPLPRTGLPTVGSLLGPLRALVLLLPLLLVLAAVLVPGEALRITLAALLVLSGGLLFERRLGPLAFFVAALASVAWAVSLGVELVFVRDHLAGGDWQRMNTVFKFGLQVWVLLATAAALALPLLVGALRRAHPIASGGAIGLLAALTLATLVYPLVGTASRLATRFESSPVPTLDGLAFMDGATFCLAATPPKPDPVCGAEQVQIALAGDHAAIGWLTREVTGTQVVLQSEKEFYRAYAVRVAANTGLPTVVGELHSFEQRPPSEVSRRVADVQTIYNTDDAREALRLLARYGVGYVYVGAIERALYAQAGIAKFDQLVGSYLSVAYQNPSVTIYAVNESVRRLADASALRRLPTADEVLSGKPPASPQEEPLDVVPFPVQDAPVQPAAGVSQQQDAEDLATLEDRVRANPADAGASYDLGRRYRDLSRYDDGAAVLATAARANPSDVGLHHLWGDLLADAQRYEEAAEAYRLAAEAGPSAGNFNKLGAALLQWGRPQEAEQALLRAVSIDPNAPDPHYFLGKLLQQRGERGPALARYEQYLQLAPDGQFRADAEQQTASLRQ